MFFFATVDSFHPLLQHRVQGLRVELVGTSLDKSEVAFVIHIQTDILILIKGPSGIDATLAIASSSL